MKTGKLVFKLHGEKLAGSWELVRIAKPEDTQGQWLLLKKMTNGRNRTRNTMS
jgi:bifunctional non-homologous end joining protein LigD